MVESDSEAKYAAMLDNLGRAVELSRAEDGTSRKTLAEQSGLSERFIADVEHRRANPSLRSMFALGEALSLEVPQMLSSSAELAPRLTNLLVGMSRLEQEEIADLVEARLAAQRPGVRVALLGMRGAGKTTVGRLLAKQLGFELVELDALVEARAGLKLAQIFEIHGEPYYRRLEREVLRETLLQKGDRVLATGGGIVTNPEAYEMLRIACRTVWLKTRPEEYLARVLKQGDRRPVERRPKALAELKAMLTAREPEYRKAELMIDTSSAAPEQVVKKIAAWVGRKAA